MSEFEKPDPNSWAHKDEDGKRDYRVDGKCTATCSEETESCKGYKWSLIFGGCAYLGRCSGKCLRPTR